MTSLFSRSLKILCYHDDMQIFRKEEQNFVYANEIDNMALIMPSQDKHSVPAVTADPDRLEGKGRKKDTKKRSRMTSLNVACLKRLLPIGLNMFGGREQELVQQAKQRLVLVSMSCDMDASVAQMPLTWMPLWHGCHWHGRRGCRYLVEFVVFVFGCNGT